MQTNNLAVQCLFCRPWDFGQESQILLRSDNLYLFAGLGQIVDGYILIAPYRCDDQLRPLRCLADFPILLLDELLFLRGLVSDFYRATYSYGHAGMHFEHGRMNLCTQDLLGARHCCHAHLCCYPVSIALWDNMHDLRIEQLQGLYELKHKCRNSQYLLLQACVAEEKESPISYKREQWISRLAIVSDSEKLTSQYFRRLLSNRVGEPESWNWTEYPTWDKINRLMDDFRQWLSIQNKYVIKTDEENVPHIDLFGSIARSNEVGNDAVADEFYRKWRGKEMHDVVGKFLKLLPEMSADRRERPKVLDVGCGPGTYLKVFHDLGIECTGIDVSEQMLTIARKQAPTGAESCFDNQSIVHPRLLKMSVFDLDLGKQRFDGIWCSALLVHVPSVRASAILTALHRCLKDNGVLYISVQTGADPDIRLNGRVFYYYQDRSLKHLFRDAGFRVIEDWGTEVEHSTCGNHRKNWRHYLLRKQS